jgi:hypothetical protein
MQSPLSRLELLYVRFRGLDDEKGVKFLAGSTSSAMVA